MLNVKKLQKLVKSKDITPLQACRENVNFALHVKVLSQPIFNLVLLRKPVLIKKLTILFPDRPKFLVPKDIYSNYRNMQRMFNWLSINEILNAIDCSEVPKRAKRALAGALIERKVQYLAIDDLVYTVWPHLSQWYKEEMFQTFHKVLPYEVLQEVNNFRYVHVSDTTLLQYGLLRHVYYKNLPEHAKQTFEEAWSELMYFSNLEVYTQGLSISYINNMSMADLQSYI